jgi:hypothetical protein
MPIHAALSHGWDGITSDLSAGLGRSQPVLSDPGHIPTLENPNGGVRIKKIMRMAAQGAEIEELVPGHWVISKEASIASSAASS